MYEPTRSDRISRCRRILSWALNKLLHRGQTKVEKRIAEETEVSFPSHQSLSLSLSLVLYIYIYAVSISLIFYICIERERERERELYPYFSTANAQPSCTRLVVLPVNAQSATCTPAATYPTECSRHFSSQASICCGLVS